MNSLYKSISPRELTDNAFRLIGDDWMLITAGNIESYNTMTASWGGLGILWNLSVAICYIRPHRHTFIFTEQSDYFTLSFFEEEHREILNFCGSRSGRDFDKAKETGLIPFSTDRENVSFEQAVLILECKKIYSDDIKPENFVLNSIIESNYPKKDFHRFYIGEIKEVMIRKPIDTTQNISSNYLIPVSGTLNLIKPDNRL